jgi:ribosomal protein S27E
MTANSRGLMIVMCVSIIIKPRELAVMSCVLVYYHQATRVSCHVMCVSIIIKPRELAVMSCVLVYYHQATRVSCHVMCGLMIVH